MPFKNNFGITPNSHLDFIHPVVDQHYLQVSPGIHVSSLLLEVLRADDTMTKVA